MSLEVGTYISDLVPANPSATDPKSQGDDHLRLIKTTVRNTFPNVTNAVTATHTQLNLLTGLVGPLVFAAGTRLAFNQASAPTGWTQDVSAGIHNRMFRVVNTAGGGTGGSSSPILNNTVPAHTHGFSTGGQSSDHSHADSGHTHPTSSFPTNVAGSTIFLTTGGANSQLVSGTGSGNANLGGVSSGHTHSGTTDVGSSQTDWVPRYTDMIICVKD